MSRRLSSVLLLALLSACAIGLLAPAARDAHERYRSGGRFIYVITLALPGRTNRTFRARELNAWPWAEWGRYEFHDIDSGEGWSVPKDTTPYRRVPQR